MKNSSKSVCSVLVENLDYGYPGHPMLIRNLSFEAQGGDVVCIVGHPMAGKTTLCRLLGGYLKPISGNIEITGRRVLAFGMSSSPAEFLTVAEYLRFKAAEFALRDYDLDKVLELAGMGSNRRYQLRKIGGALRLRLSLLLLFSTVEASTVIMDSYPGGRDEKTQKLVAPLVRGFTERGGILIYTKRKYPRDRANVIVDLNK